MNPNPRGLCQCGCGGVTAISPVTDPRRGAVKGFPRRFLVGHNGRKAIVSDYRKTLDGDGNRRRVHVLRAEQALGRPLPKGAVVHHADGTKRDTATLVICQDQAYHMFLHARMRIKSAGGDPNTDAICGTCRMVKPRSAFYGSSVRQSGITTICRECKSAYDAADFVKRKTRLGPYWRDIHGVVTKTRQG